MVSMRVSIVGAFWLAIIAIAGGPVRAEDFSIHLEELAEIDVTRAAPAYTLERVPVPEEGYAEKGMTVTVYDVVMRFEKFGRADLDRGVEEVPHNHPTNASFGTGLTDLNEIKAGWIKGTADLFIVGWVNGHGAGNDPTPDYVLAVFQLKDGHSFKLLQTSYGFGVRTISVDWGWPLQSCRFSWDAQQKCLVERVTIDRWINSPVPGPLLRPAGIDEVGTKGFAVEIHETLALTYRLAEGKLTPDGASLFYQAGDNDDLAEIAAFYLVGKTHGGEPREKPFKDQSSAVKALLQANPTLAARLKTATSRPARTLKKGDEILIPLPARTPVARDIYDLITIPADRENPKDSTQK